MRVLFSNVLVAGRDGGSSNNSIPIPIPTETNQLSNGIPQCMFIIIIIFIVPCLTIIHGYKQSFSICFSSCVGVWVCGCVCDSMYLLFLCHGQTRATPGFWFLSSLYYHVCMNDSLTSCTSFCPSFFFQH